MNNNNNNYIPDFQIPKSGETVAVSVDGKLFVNPSNKKYLESISDNLKSDVQKQIEKKTVSHAGISTPSRNRVNNKPQVDDEGEKLERLISLKNERTRLERQLNNLNKLIETLEND